MPYITKTPKLLKYYGELLHRWYKCFSKRIVKDICDLTPIVHEEQKNFFWYDDSSIIIHTFFIEVNKKNSCYSLISLEYDKANANLLNSKNRLKFDILNNSQKEFITQQLEDILNAKKIETLDSKIINFSIILIRR